MRRILMFFAALALLSSCNTKGEQDWSGMEHITFDVGGRVTDENGEPLKNIAVVTAYGDTVRTNSAGVYMVAGSCKPVTNVIVSYSDTDGEENGGRFTRIRKTVDLEYTGGAHGPYAGKYEARGVDVKMLKDQGIKPVDPNESLDP